MKEQNDINDIDQLIAAYLRGTLNKQEKKEIKSWMAQSQENAFQVRELQQYWKERSCDLKLIDHERQKSKIWAAHQNQNPSAPSGKQIFLNFNILMKMAVAVLILAIPAFFIYQHKSTEGENLVPNDLLNEIVKHNPPGQKSQIKLPDGSTVWLNAESTISYSNSFSDSVREVKLEGEAFFEIKKDSLRPFYVNTEKLQVHVLGTGFNVSAYNSDENVTVALIHGSVKVLLDNETGNEDVVLSPGNALTYSKGTKIHETSFFADDPLLFDKYNSWRNGTLIFDGQDFDEFVQKISRWYGLEVSVSGVPPVNWHIRASFQNEYLSNILEAISFNKEFAHEINDKKLILIFN